MTVARAEKKSFDGQDAVGSRTSTRSTVAVRKFHTPDQYLKYRLYQYHVPVLVPVPSTGRGPIYWCNNPNLFILDWGRMLVLETVLFLFLKYGGGVPE